MDSWYTNRLGLPRAAEYARKAGQQRIPAETVGRSTGTFTVEIWGKWIALPRCLRQPT